ncbi:MAG: serine protease [uncultured bacterium]|nr:MAG: serine protease [uncultured bacterium]
MKLKESFNLSLKILVALLISASIFGGLLIYAGVKSIQWGAGKYEKIKNDQNLFSELGEMFEKKDIRNVQPIKVVDEQSQVIEVVKKASPAVVSIVASAQIPTFETYFDTPYGMPEEFGQFFSMPRQRQNGTQEQKIGAGTGFLVSSDGYIITNKHVVSEQEADYTVYLNDESNRGEKMKARVIALDPKNDLAVLKIEKDGLPHLAFADSGGLQVGQTVITIGYALGEFDNTVSKGVISGLSRSITAGGGMQKTEQLKNLIQSDAAINPGNSGGPMLDIEGNVIGVNVAMASAENIGFAILGNEAREVFEQVKNTGTISGKETAFLGVRYLPITEGIQKQNKLPYGYGALVSRGETRSELAVTPGSPADKAGLVENDIILEINEEKINERNALADIVSRYKPGEEITLKVYHRGEEKDVKAVLGKN